MLAARQETLADLLLERARTDSSRLAFAERGRAVTFGELAERAAALGAGLHARGVVPGDRVAVTMSSSLALVEVFWAVQLVGAAPCVINPAASAPTLARRVERVRPRLVVTDELAAELRGHRGPLPERATAPEDLAFLQLTSGTSGEARASMISHRNALTYLRCNRTAGFLDPDDVFVAWAPPWHDLGLVRFVLGTVYHGASCHLVEAAVRTIPEWMRTISEVGGTYSASPDFALRLAVRMVNAAEVDLASLRFMKAGAEPIRKSTIDGFEEHFGVPGTVAPGYGLGEATLGVSEHLPGEEMPVDEHGTISSGPVNEGLEVRAGSPGEPAEIRVRGDSVFGGYFDAPEETARALREGWLHTGDAGYLDEQGRLFVLGRREGMIKRAGAVIAPRELEEAAQRVEQVRLAAAVSATIGAAETVVVAVEADGAPDEQVAAAVSREVVKAVGFAPGRVVVLPPRSIPRTGNGKIRHAATRELLERDLG